MADQEVNIGIKTSVQGDGLEATRRKIEELYKAAAAYESKGMGTAAGSARSEAKSLERDLAKDARERAMLERDITRSQREQQAVQRASGQGTDAGMVTRRGVRALAQAAAIGQVAEALIVDASERRGIVNRDRANRAVDARETGLMRSFRGSAGQVFGDIEGSERERFRREQDRPEIQRRTWTEAFSDALKGAGVGGTVGAAAGSVIPGVGTVGGAIVGGLIGGVSGGVRGVLRGRREAQENESEITRESDKIAERQKVLRELYQREAGMEVAAQRARIDGNFKEAMSLQAALDGAARFSELRRQGATPEEAREGAMLNLRERQMSVMRGLGALASATDGRGNIDALRSLAGGVPWTEMITRMDAQISLLQRNEPNSAKETFKR